MPRASSLSKVAPTAARVCLAATLVGCSGSKHTPATAAETRGAEPGESTNAGGMLPPALAVPPAASPADHGALFPPLHEARLQSGAELVVVERPHAKALTVRVVVIAPSATLRERRTAAFAMDAALRGSARQQAQRLARFGSHPTLEVTGDAAHIAWTVPAAHAEAALDELGRTLHDPQLLDFETLAWQLERAEQRRMRTDPEWLASYLDAMNPTQSTRSRPQLFECQRWLRRWLRPTHTRFVLIGPWRAPDAKERLDEALSGWKAPPLGQETPRAAPELSADPSRQLRLANAEGTSFAHLRLSFAGPPRSSAPRERVWTHLAWGSLALRTSEQLQSAARDVRAADVRTGIGASRDHWRLHIDLSVPTERALELATRTSEEVTRIAREGFSELDLTRAAGQLRARFRRALHDHEQLAWQLAWLFEHGFDAAALERELVSEPDRAKVDATWADQALAAEHMTVSVVGDAQRLERALASLRDVLVFEPKRELQLGKRLAHDPDASPAIDASAREESQ